MSGSRDVARSNAKRLYEYLRTIVEMRLTPVRTYDKYESVMWLSEVPRESGCSCALWDALEHIEETVDPNVEVMQDEERPWIQVRKPQRTAPPELPGELIPWIADAALDNPLDTPEPREALPRSTSSSADDEATDELVYFTDEATLVAQWDRYLSQKWLPWAAEEKPKRLVLQTYNRLWTLYNRQMQAGEAFETVLGLGLLTWRTPSGNVVRRHIAVADVTLDFDAARAVMRVMPGVNGTRVRLEDDMLEPQERPAAGVSERIGGELESTGEAIWALLGPFSQQLREYAECLASDSVYDLSLVPTTQVVSRPHLQLAPALLMRKRAERYLVRVFDDMIQQLEDGGELPGGVEAQVAASAGPSIEDVGQADEGTSRSAIHDDEVFFPLASNDEQREIAEKLDSSRGIVVQGPPGTGKSHTIVNLLSHLLAKGQRVLVTSQTTRALSVLREKIPDAVAPLVVTLLGADLQSKQSLERSVAGITAEYAHWNEHSAAKSVESLTKSLDERRREQARLLNELRAIRSSETTNHSVGRYSGTAESIARDIARDSEAHGWILELESSCEGDAPLTSEQATELVGLLRQIDANTRAELATELLAPADLPSPEDIAVAMGADRLMQISSQASERPSETTLRAVQDALLLAPELRDIAPESSSIELAILAAGMPDEMSLVFPPMGELKTPFDLSTLIEEERSSREEWLRFAGTCELPDLDALAALGRDELERIAAVLAAFVAERVAVDVERDGWVATAVSQTLLGHDRRWREQLQLSGRIVESARERANRLSFVNVTGLGSRDFQECKAAALALKEHLGAGRSLKPWLLQPKDVRRAKFIPEDVLFDGLKCTSLEQIDALLDWLELNLSLRALRDMWSHDSQSPAAVTLAEFETFNEVLARVLKLRSLQQEALSGLPNTPSLTALDWSDSRATVALDQCVRAALHQLRAADAEKPLGEYVDALGSERFTAPEVQRLRQAVLDRSESDYAQHYEALAYLNRLRTAATTVQTGLAAMVERLRDQSRPFVDAKLDIAERANSGAHHHSVDTLLEALASCDPAAYREAYGIAREVQALHRGNQRIDELLRALQPTMPHLVHSLVATAAEAHWDDRMSQFAAASEWLSARTWVRKLADPEYEQRMRLRLSAERESELAVVGKLAGQLAWSHCFERMDDKTLSALKGWQQAIQRAGKRKGKYTHVFLRKAREYMNECRPAIPAWIMPLYSVAESVEMVPNAFDVVIVDEASQCGPEAWFLQYIAKKIVVVGDDKQISPLNVGLKMEQALQSHRDLAADLPNGDVYIPGYSLFAGAQVRFRGLIRLREHFRCMPEIIEFSNRLCYNQTQPLVPLRQYGTDRLKPVIRTVYVSDGYNRGDRNPANPPEAQALVEAIEECVNARAYAGKTFGVISLLGQRQAELIEAELVRRIGAEEMAARRLVCGDAYDFQGDERDVVFLSMVKAPGSGVIPQLSGERYEQRYNVAVSRAKDQLWLFHSVTLDDLNPECVRSRLLSYCLNPELPQIRGIELTSLRQLARSEHSGIKAPYPFDSWFEADVCLRIADRGYDIIPQYELGGYRIDLLIAGSRARVAVECDGDAWHGVEQYDHDIARQRQLERCGLQFFRVRGSSFYLDPDGALSPLWQLLDELDIRPGAPEGSAIPTTLRSETSGHDVTEFEELVASLEMVGEGDSREQDDDDAAGPRVTETPDTKESDGPVSIGASAQLEKPGVGTQYPLFSTGSLANIPDSVIAAVEGLPAFNAWKVAPLKNPASASQLYVVDRLVEIVAAEGPIPFRRAYEVYAKAAGMPDIEEGKAKHAFNSAAWKSVYQQHRLLEANELGTKDQINRIARVKGGGSVRLRQRGDRALRHVPPSEWAELFAVVTNADAGLSVSGRDAIIRTAVIAFGVEPKNYFDKRWLDVAWELFEKSRLNAPQSRGRYEQESEGPHVVGWDPETNTPIIGR